jgi:hypothetical protein
MKKWRCKLTFIYSDVVHVEAETKEEAEKLALVEAEPMYEYWDDSEIEEEE